MESVEKLLTNKLGRQGRIHFLELFCRPCWLLASALGFALVSDLYGCCFTCFHFESTNDLEPNYKLLNESPCAKRNSERHRNVLARAQPASLGFAFFAKAFIFRSKLFLSNIFSNRCDRRSQDARPCRRPWRYLWFASQLTRIPTLWREDIFE